MFEMATIQAPRSLHMREETFASHQVAVERVIRVMRSAPGEQLALEDMADIACLSPFYFHRVFQTIVGISPFEFLAALRFDAAKNLLLTTSMRVTDVCYEVGYNGLGSFSTRFTQEIGYSPRELRSLPGMLAPQLQQRNIQPSLYMERRVSSRASIRGVVDAPGLLDCLIFVGLFPRPVPQAQIVASTLLTAPGRYTLPPVAAGTYYLRVAALPRSADPLTYILPQNPLLVGTSDAVTVSADAPIPTVDIALRPPLLTDPPILLVLA